MHDVNRKMAKGAAWMVLFKLLERSIGLISTLILARLLMPADFGLIAMATSIIAVLELLGAFNFDVALIQNSQADRSHYDTAWTFNVLFGLACAGLLIALSRPAAGFYHEPRLQPVMSWLAVATLIGGFENVGVVAFRKEMRFDKEFKFLLAKKLIAFAVTVPLAILLRSYWALVAGMVTSRASGVAISYLSQPFKPRLSLAAKGDLFHFSRWLMLNNLLFFLVHRSADFVIGKLSGPTGLGLYSIGYETSNLPTTELVAPINRAVFPGYSKIAGDLAALRKSFLEVTGVIALLAVPVGVGIAAVAYPMVDVLLGRKWIDAAPLIEILAFYGIVGALQTNTGSVYLALGTPRILTLTTAIYVAILLPLMVVGIQLYGLRGAAWAFLITALINMPINLGITARKLKMSIGSFAGTVWRPLLAAGMMYILVGSLFNTRMHSLHLPTSMLILLADVGIGALVYPTALLLLWMMSGKPDGAERVLLDRLKVELINHIRCNVKS